MKQFERLLAVSIGKQEESSRGGVLGYPGGS
jgi:hypothetical protein